MAGDPFAPARRALLIGPAIGLAGGALIYLGISGEGSAWLWLIPGALLAFFGLSRLLAGVTVLGMERKRVSLLREGVPATATITSSRLVRRKAGFPIYDIAMDVTREDGTRSTLSKQGAIPPQFEGSVDPGTELRLRVDANPHSKLFAVDWDQA